MKKKIKILLTNDDGITAPGLFALHKEMKKMGDISVVAPDSEKSAVGHAITLSDPLRVSDYKKNGDFFGYAVNGTPADCVKLAYWALGIKPDLLISGINLGSNTGINIIYSGTVSAATEGVFLNIPSFAISLTTFLNPNFSVAAKFARKLSQIVLDKGLPEGTLLNVNVPSVKKESDLQGVQITRQGTAMYHEEFDKRTDPHKRVYYWLTGQKVKLEKDPDVDDRAILNNKISITPVHFDLTNHDYLDELRDWKIEY
ncbi:5'/3'-nucleotidase SurE [candidate division KSB1 bacterium]|nr:5'/3'-nucleotidase SurE [candidate division KSB1 bacterium]MBL7095400.1 5'/3'-nucleotidase SurE [candidate division KSB1 bacterium]